MSDISLRESAAQIADRAIAIRAALLMTLRTMGKWVLTISRMFAMKKFVLNMFMVRLLSRQSNFEQSSLPVLTVLLLLTGEHLEEGDGASEREDGTSGVWAHQRSFFEVLLKVLGERLGDFFSW